MRLVLIIILVLYSSGAIVGQAKIEHRHIRGKKGFQGKQNIHILSIPFESLKEELSLELAWSDSILIKTSRFADSLNALAAINAGFFNVKEGGSVTYLEMENERVARRSWRGDPDDFQKSNLNGALILDCNNNVVIEYAKSSKHYINSHLEKWVLITGPVLVTDGRASELLSNSFVTNKHPRTCLGMTNERILLITVDGRNKKAKGMSLTELQDFLLQMECTYAINLDGGGSTTMWLRTSEYGQVINCPSDNGKFDNQGERKVANALLLLSN